MIFNWELIIFSSERDSIQIEQRKSAADVEALFDSFRFRKNEFYEYIL